MTPEIRPYQTAAVDTIAERMRVGVRSLVYVAPTGSGKTVVASLLAKRAVERGRSIMFLVHRRELVRQAYETMSEALPGEAIGVEAAGWPSIPWARIRVGSVQSLARRIANIPAPHVVFVDEAHHARARTWEMVLGAWPRARLVGLTATPERLDGLGLGEWFAEIVEGPGPGELIEGGYLAPTRVLRVHASQAFAWRGTNTIADPVWAYQRYTPGERMLFFGRTVQHSKDVCAAFRAAGISAEHVDGDRHRRPARSGGRGIPPGQRQVLGNCQAVRRGFRRARLRGRVRRALHHDRRLAGCRCAGARCARASASSRPSSMPAGARGIWGCRPMRARGASRTARCASADRPRRARAVPRGARASRSRWSRRSSWRRGARARGRLRRRLHKA